MKLNYEVFQAAVKSAPVVAKTIEIEVGDQKFPIEITQTVTNKDKMDIVTHAVGLFQDTGSTQSMGDFALIVGILKYLTSVELPEDTKDLMTFVLGLMDEGVIAKIMDNLAPNTIEEIIAFAENMNEILQAEIDIQPQK